MISEGHVSFESGFMLLSMSAHSFILVFSDTVISVFCFGFFYYGKTHLIFNTSILQYGWGGYSTVALLYAVFSNIFGVIYFLLSKITD